MKTHSAAEIVEKLPPEFISGDKETYIKAVENARQIFSTDGLLDEKDIKTPLDVLTSFNDKVKAAKIDLSKTYTNEFVAKVPATASN